MIKLTIPTQEKKRFKKLFKFFYSHNCELCIFPEGLKWRNGNAEGIVFNRAFKDYDFKHRRRLGKVGIQDRKKLSKFFTSWNDIKGFNITEIPLKV